MDTLPEELLINNCAIWLARLESLSHWTIYRAAKELDANRKMGMFGKLFTLGSKGEAGLSDIVANADKYVITLEARSRNSPDSADIVQNYRQRRECATIALAMAARRQRLIVKLLIFGPLSCLFAIVIGGLFFGSSIDKSERLESERLEKIVEKADQAIAAKDYNQAKYFISQLQWSVGSGGGSNKKVWDEKRDGMLSAVEKMSDNSKQ